MTQAQGQRLGTEIERIRANTKGKVVLLEGASVSLAMLGAGLAFRQLLRSVSAQEIERQASARRAADLAARAEVLGQFAGAVAHDVLSPLTSTSLSLDAASDACGHDAAARRSVERGRAGLHRVETLVHGLLAFSRAGGRPEPGATTELAPVITAIVSGLDEQARQERIDLQVRPLPAGAVACSEGVLTSLVSNLVRNAIRYMGDAPERRIDVRVLPAERAWRVEVEDTGPGVPPDEQQRILEPYVQLRRGSAGIGLGLATVERLVHGHGGAIGVISPVARDRGSRFWFELPKAVG